MRVQRFMVSAGAHPVDFLTSCRQVEGHGLGVSFKKYQLLCKGRQMGGPDILSTSVLTRAENWQRKRRQICAQVGGLLNPSLHIICIHPEKNSSPSSDSPHPLLCPLHLEQLEGHSSSRTFQSNWAGIDLEVLAPTWSPGEMQGAWFRDFR